MYPARTCIHIRHVFILAARTVDRFTVPELRQMGSTWHFVKAANFVKMNLADLRQVSSVPRGRALSFAKHVSLAVQGTLQNTAHHPASRDATASVYVVGLQQKLCEAKSCPE